MVKKYRGFFFFISLCLLVFMVGCNQEQEPLFSNVEISASLGDIPQDVYFIFTNSSTTDATEVSPSISYSEISRTLSASYSSVSYMDGLDTLSTADSSIKQQIIDFNKSNYIARNNTARSISPPSYSFTPVDEPRDEKDDTATFYLDSTIQGSSISATCRFANSEDIDGIYLSIWVANDCWSEDGSIDEKISESMVIAMANEFLSTDPEGDVYEWVTDIYGEPWGASADNFPSSVIPGSEASKITIFLYDIPEENVCGFYWSKDNFLQTSCSGSNERVMFYMDSVMFATEDNSSWDITDSYPEMIISTLGHEFQHMIQFYQKQIVYNTDSTDTWVNEMCSEITEDLLAEKLGVAGPRGIRDNGFAGDDEIMNSRLNDFNIHNDSSLVLWDSDVTDYSMVYSFGAYLARNYGGAALFRNIVQSYEIDEQAVVTAVNSVNNLNLTFEDLLAGWGKSVLRSDTAYSSGYTRYNSTDGYFISFPDNPDGTDYSLGSINLENYGTIISEDWTLYGPKIYNGNISNPLTTLQPGSNTYYLAGTGLTGEQNWNVELPTGVKLTVVKKDS